MVANLEGFLPDLRKGTGAAVKFSRKAWENFGATVLAKISNK